jgi:hypothetical protein
MVAHIKASTNEW